MSYTFIKEALASDRIVLLDGATGTELQRRGVATKLPLWSSQALIEAPAIVKQIHEDYVRAGADILTTNTFRTSRHSLDKAGLGHHTERLNHLAVDLARQATAGAERPIVVAGSLAPLEDCYAPELVLDEDICRRGHGEQARILAEAGADFLLLETFNKLSEGRAALQAARATGLPVWMGWVVDQFGNLLSGEPLEEAARVSEQYGAAVIFLNCRPLATLTPALKRLTSLTRLPVGAYANGAGKPHDDQGWIFDEKVGVQEYMEHVDRWVRDFGVRIVCGCCGTTPEYIRQLAAAYQKVPV